MILRLTLIIAFILPVFAYSTILAVPEIAARSYILVDEQSGQTLAEKNADLRIEPASLTKLMTAYLAFKAIKAGYLKPDQTLTVSLKGWRAEGSRMFLDPKVPVTVADLIQGIIIQSGNDACITLAEYLAGSEDAFAVRMTQQAKEMGMRHTQFKNSTGLPADGHYTTARDIAKLSVAMIRDFPEFYPIYALKEFTYNNIRQTNRNLLLYRDAFIDGIKTGHTASAGYNLVASTHRDGRRLISVVTGTRSEKIRADESEKLLNWGLRSFDTSKRYIAKQAIATLRVWKGKQNKVDIGLLQDGYLTIPKGEANQIHQEMKVDPFLMAPLTLGQPVGTLKLSMGNQLIGEYPLFVLTSIEQANILGRVWDTICLWFR